MGDSSGKVRSWRVSDRGNVLAHFVDPRLALDEQAASLRSLLAAASEGHEHLPQPPEHEVLYIAGQCDLLLRLELPDLRFVSQLQKHLLNFPALSSTWVYSVPLAAGRELQEHPAVSQGAGGRLPIHFVLYLRFRRPFYRLKELESAVIDKLYDRLAAAGFDGEVHLGMGWSDLLVQGAFDSSIESFFAFLLAVEGIHVGHGDKRQPVLQRTLTLLGFPSDAKPAPYVPLQPVIFAQTSPGYYLAAHGELERRLGAELAASRMDRLLSLDGRYDLMVPLRPPSGHGGFPEYVQKLFELARDDDSLQAVGVDRLETHLLTVEVENLPPMAGEEELVLSGFRPLDQPDCRCADHRFADLRDELDQLAPDVFPEELKTTVANVLTLFGYALNDRTNCCDAWPALQASAQDLRRLLGRIRSIHTLLENRPERGPYYYEALEEMREYLDTWCVLAERVLSERTAGSFLQFFDQTDRVAAYRGGVQKLVHLADHLAAEFYEGTLADPPAAKGHPLFATVYEPIDTIQSEKVLAVIKVPLRYRFTLSLVLPQIWHEVGQFLFSERYPVPVCEVTSRRLYLLQLLLQDDDGVFRERTKDWGLPDDELSRLRDVRKRLQKSEERFHVDPPRLLSDLGDLYADLVVFTFGFLEDWPSFVHYLSTLFFESKTKRNAPPEVWGRHCMALAMRLFFVLQFAVRKMAQQDTSVLHFSDRTEGVRKSYAEEVATAIRQVAQEPSYSSIELPPKLAERLYVNITDSAVYSVFFEKYLEDFLAVHGTAKPAATSHIREVAKRLEKGELVDFAEGERINDHYYHLYCAAVESLAVGHKPSTFRHMAALGKSASSAFYLRQLAAVDEQSLRSDREPVR